MRRLHKHGSIYRVHGRIMKIKAFAMASLAPGSRRVQIGCTDWRNHQDRPDRWQEMTQPFAATNGGRI